MLMRRGRLGCYMANMQKQNRGDVVRVAGSERLNGFFHSLIVQICEMARKMCDHFCDGFKAVNSINSHAEMSIYAENVASAKIGIACPGSDFNPFQAFFQPVHKWFFDEQ